MPYSVINVRERRSYPLLVEQNLKTPKAPEISASTPVTRAKNQGGRPKGSRTKDKREVELTPELQKIKRMVSQL